MQLLQGTHCVPLCRSRTHVLQLRSPVQPKPRIRHRQQYSPPGHAYLASNAMTRAASPEYQPVPGPGNGQGYTVEQAMNLSGFGKYQWLLLFYAGMAWMGDAMEVMILSYLGPACACQWQLTANQESFLTALVFAGMCVGTVGWGLLSDTKGRRVAFLASAAVTCIAGALSAAAPNYEALLVSRMLVGLGLSGAPVVYSLLMELLPTKQRGVVMVAVELFWTAGTVLEAGLAWLFINTAGWRPLLLVSSTPLVLLLAFSSFLPESPRYLLSQGRVAEAEAVLLKIAATNKVQLPAGGLVATAGAAGTEQQRQEQERLLWPEPQEEEEEAGWQQQQQQQQQREATASISGKQQEPQKQQQRAEEHECEQELPAWHPSSSETAAPAGAGGSAARSGGSISSGSIRVRIPGKEAGGWDPQLPARAGDEEQQLLVADDDSKGGQPSSKAYLGQLLQGTSTAFQQLLSPNLRGMTGLLLFSWSAAAFAYYGLVQLVTQLHMGSGEAGRACVEGSLHVASEDFIPVFVAALAEIPANAWAAASTSLWGRRAATASSLAFTSLALLPLLLGLQSSSTLASAAVAAPMDGAAAAAAAGAVNPGGGGFDWVGVGSLFLSRLFATSAFTLLWVFTPELYPTTIRTFGLGLNNAAGRIGGLLSPFAAVNLVQEGKGSTAAGVFALATGMAAAAIALVPRDTSGHALVDSVEEMDNQEQQRQRQQQQQEQQRPSQPGPAGGQGVHEGHDL